MADKNKQTQRAQPLGSAGLTALFESMRKTSEDVTPHEWTSGPGATLADLPSTASRIAIFYARSKAGKSFGAEVVCEEALANGHDNLAIADFDRDNPSLGKRFGAKQVIRPIAATQEHFELAFSHTLELQKATGCDVVLDIGFGGLREFREFALSKSYQLTLEESEIRSVLVVMLTPNLDDLDPVKALDGIFVPKDIILVVNEGAIDKPSPDVTLEFGPVLNDPFVRGLLKRKARLMHLPRLPNGRAFHNSRLPFASAGKPHPDNPLNSLERAGANVWLEKTRKALAANADLLPIRKLT